MFRQQRIQLFQRLDIAKDVGHMAQHKAVCAVSNGLFRLFQQQRILPQCTAQHGQLEVVPLDQLQYRGGTPRCAQSRKWQNDGASAPLHTTPC